MTPADITLGVVALVLVGVIGYLARLLAQSQAQHTAALERMLSLREIGTPTLQPASIIRGIRDPEERITEDLDKTEGAITEETIAAGMVSLAQMYKDRGAQVPRSKDLRRQVEQMLNGEVPTP